MLSLHENDIDRIFIVHGITGYDEREKRLVDVLGKQHSLRYEFVTEYRNSDENERWTDHYFIPGIREVLSSGAIQCTLVHFLIYERFLKGGKRYAIIFENDVYLLRSFAAQISGIMHEAKQLEPGFIVSLENSTLNFPSWRKTKRGKYLYEENRGRCAGAYLIDRECAQAMIRELSQMKCDTVIDWWHNGLIQRKAVRMYWCHPPVIEQGSFNGSMPSSISRRKSGSIRKLQWTIQKSWKMYVSRYLLE